MGKENVDRNCAAPIAAPSDARRSLEAHLRLVSLLQSVEDLTKRAKKTRSVELILCMPGTRAEPSKGLALGGIPTSLLPCGPPKLFFFDE